MNGLQKIIKFLAIGLGIFIIVCIGVVILSVIGLITNIDFLTGKTIDFNKTYEDIKVIEIDSEYSKIIIKKGDYFEVDATSVSSKFTAKEKNQVLTIKEKRNWLLFFKEKGTIVVTIPENVELEKLKIDTGASTLEINEISVNNLDINQGAGAISIIDSNFNKTSIDGGAGKMTISNSSLNDLELDCGVGEVIIEAKITGDSEIDCGVGELDITLIGSEDDYRINVEKGIGSIKIDKKDIDSGAYGTGNNRIDIDGGVGSIKIKFKL